ncbi:MAG TPA: TlpA disulfide reductase family protein [Burkholderiaceae bacterium]
MRAHSFSAGLLFSTLLLAAAFAARADEGSAAAAPDAASIKVSMLKALNLDESAQIQYQDEQGKSLDDMGFFAEVAHGKSFGARKSKEGGILKATLYLESKEQAQAASKSDPYTVKPGQTFPAYRLRQLAGGSVGSKQFAGHTTLLNFYFAECGPCRGEIAELNALAASHPEMKFLAVTFDSAGDARKFVKETKFEWNIAADAVSFINKIGIKSYPTFALIGADGKLLAIKQRANIGDEEGRVEKWVDSLLPGSKVE